MKLSQNIIYYQLSREFKVRFIKENEYDIMYEIPVFYEEKMDISNSLVIISLDEIKNLKDRTSNTLFICAGNSSDIFDFPDCTLIAFNEDVSPVTIYNYLQKVFLLFNQWDEELKKICYESGSFQDLVDCCDKILFDPLAISDTSFNYVAYSLKSIERGLDAYIDSNKKLPTELANEYGSDYRLAKLSNFRSVFTFTTSVIYGIAKNIFYLDKDVGRISIQLNEKDELLEKYYTAVLNHAAVFTEKMYDKNTSFNLDEIRVNSIRSLILDCLNKKKNVSNEQWAKTLLENGWTTEDELQLLEFRPNPRYDKDLHAKHINNQIERKWKGCLCFDWYDHILLLVNRDRFSSCDRIDFNQALAYFLRDNLLVAGLSRPFYKSKHLNSAFEQADIAIEYGVQRTPTLWYFRFDDHVLDYMLNNCVGSQELDRICSEKLLTLKKYDVKHKTELYKSLLTYFGCKFNAAEASKKLFIHRSSFLYRLERIQELVNIDYESFDELIYLMMSIKILQGINNEDA